MREKDADLNGWAIAYTQDHGPARAGYMGKLVHEADGIVKLTEAVEFTSVVRAVPNGGTVRACHGIPLEFTSTLSEVKVRYMALVKLDGLTPEERAAFNAAVREAAEAKASLRQTGPEDTKLVQPVGPQGIVGPTGEPIIKTKGATP